MAYFVIFGGLGSKVLHLQCVSNGDMNVLFWDNITVTLHDNHDVWNHPQLEFFSSFRQPTKKKYLSSALLALGEGNLSVTGGFTSQRASHSENGSKLWCYHKNRLFLSDQQRSLSVGLSFSELWMWCIILCAPWISLSCYHVDEDEIKWNEYWHCVTLSIVVEIEKIRKRAQHDSKQTVYIAWW